MALARQLAADDARMTLMHVYGAGLMPGRGAALLLASERTESERILSLERKHSCPDADLISCPERSIGRALREHARSGEADLIVVGASGRGAMGRVFLGDDASSTLNGAPAAVAVAPRGFATATHAVKRIGVGYDHSPESEQALLIAGQLAERHAGAVSALSVISLDASPGGESIPPDWPQIAARLVESERERLTALHGVQAEAVYGDPGEELEIFSRSLDLLVVGSRSHGPLGRLLNGSTSNYLARRAQCALLVLPRSATGPVTPPAAEPLSAGR